jgi:hypothetical protein
MHCVADDQTQLRIVTENLEQLFDEGQVVELRCIAEKDVRVGYFDEMEALAAHAVAIEAMGYDCYFGLAPRRARLCFPDNELHHGKAAGAKHVVRRRWLLVDVDPRKPTGVCSTAAEKKYAWRVLKEAVEWLTTDQGWPAPHIADSGNGWHALFAVDLPAEDHGLVANVLLALAAKFNTHEASIDTAVFDAPRVCRLYGTLNGKGASTPERPHRRSRLVRAGTGKVVSIEKLKSVTELARNELGERRAKDSNVNPSLNGSAGCSGTSTVLDRARAWITNQRPAVAGDKGHKQTFLVACGLVVGHALRLEEAKPLLDEYNRHCVPPWSEGELQHKLDDAFKKADAEPDRVGYLLQSGSEKAEGANLPAPLQLLSILQSQAVLWHTPEDCEPYASLKMPGCTANLPINSKEFERWLGRSVYRSSKVAPSRDALARAVETAAGIALYDGESRSVAVRIAKHDDKLFLDLANPGWEAVEITRAGWSVITDPPTKFRRPGGMLPLPTPVPGGDISELRKFLNVQEEDFILIVGWLLMALSPVGDYPVLLLNGEQGSAKSTASRLLRSLVDPNKAPLRRLAKIDDLLLAANNSQVLAFDNLSRMKNDTSDLLCSIATGLGDAKRELYTNLDEVIIQVRKPILLNGITNIATRGDLLDRCLVISLPSLQKHTGDSPFADEYYSARETYEAPFEEARPRILGALLDGVVHALAHKHEIPGTGLPRMADFARWVMAGVGAFGWDQMKFRTAYADNRQMSKGTAAEDSAIVPALRRLMANRSEWSGTGTELLTRLGQSLSVNERLRGGWWPRQPQHLSRELSRLAPVLRAEGIFIEWKRLPGGTRQRIITIRREPTATKHGLTTGRRDVRDDETLAPAEGGEGGSSSSAGDASNGHDGTVPSSLPERETQP